MLRTNYLVVIHRSLSDAEVGKDVIEGFLGGDGSAGDVGERGEGEAEILGDEVGGKG